MQLNILQSLVFMICAITCIPQNNSNDRSPGTSPSSSHPPSLGLLLNSTPTLKKRGFISWITGADAHRRMAMEANRRNIELQNKRLRQVKNYEKAKQLSDEATRRNVELQNERLRQLKHYEKAKQLSEEANRRNIELQNERLRQLKHYKKAKFAIQQKLKLDFVEAPLDPIKDEARIAAESKKALANLDSSIKAQTQILQSRLKDTSIAKPFPSTAVKGRTLRPSDIGLRSYASGSSVLGGLQKAPELQTEFNMVKNTLSHLI